MDKKGNAAIPIVIAVFILIFGMSCLFFPNRAAPTSTPEVQPLSTDTPVISSTYTKTPVVIVLPEEDGVKRVAASLNFLMTGDTSVSSYHLESDQLSPCWDGNAIAQCSQKMSADVQGKDVHFTCTETKPGEDPQTTEMYLIGDQEYPVVGGSVQPAGVSLDSLVWIMWPANTAIIIAVGDTNVTQAGTEELEGRTADIYALDGTNTPIGDVAGIALPVSSVKGQVWVDQQTGALLKASLDYQASVHDTSGAPQGSGPGHIEITISQIGNVTVALP